MSEEQRQANLKHLRDVIDEIKAQDGTLVQHKRSTADHFSRLMALKAEWDSKPPPPLSPSLIKSMQAKDAEHGVTRNYGVSDPGSAGREVAA